jgi:hypothetical protein
MSHMTEQCAVPTTTRLKTVPGRAGRNIEPSKSECERSLWPEVPYVSVKLYAKRRIGSVPLSTTAYIARGSPSYGRLTLPQFTIVISSIR